MAADTVAVTGAGLPNFEVFCGHCTVSVTRRLVAAFRRTASAWAMVGAVSGRAGSETDDQHPLAEARG